MAKTTQITPEILRRITDAVPAIIALYDIKTGQYLYVNQVVKAILGYTPEKFTEGGMKFAVSLVHPQDVGPLMEQNQQALDAANAQTGTDEPIASFEYRMRHKDGTWKWVHTDGTVFSRDSQGQVEMILNVSLDVSDRKNAELQLSRSMKILEEVLHSV